MLSWWLRWYAVRHACVGRRGDVLRGKGGTSEVRRNVYDWAEGSADAGLGVSWPNAFGLEPVVNEQEGRPIAGMTIDGMIQQTDLGLLQGLGFGKGGLF